MLFNNNYYLLVIVSVGETICEIFEQEKVFL